MQIQKIYIGGWFQRTTLHLTEIYDFLQYGKSSLGFDQGKLDEARKSLRLTRVSRENDLLEYILVNTEVGIVYRIYEDGLIVLEKPFALLENDLKAIKEYYDATLSKALSLIFSKGAPVPKELANIKTLLPYIITATGGTSEEIETLFKDSSEQIYSIVATKQVKVYRSSGMILIHNLKDDALARHIIESQIFFREFKTQLHRYLAIHREIWEEIARIKERKAIQGTEIDALRNELSDYQKTITLIDARIQQMGSYIKTRQKITDLHTIDTYLKPLFQFKFETLQDTHEYIKHLWNMTKNYLASALEIVNELQAKSTKNTISSLQLITTLGVVAGIIGYLGRNELPNLTVTGVMYFAILIALTWGMNMIVSSLYKKKRYQIKDSKTILK